MERQEPLDFETFLIQKERRRRSLKLQTVKTSCQEHKV